MNSGTLLGLPLVSAIIAYVGSRAILAWRSHLPMAHPNARSLHADPIPRIGGLAIWAASLPAFVAVSPVRGWWLPTLLVLGISLADDWRGIAPVVRLLVHGAAAALAVWLVGIDAWPARIGAVLAIVWGANLFNFMDGADGLAAAMGALGFTSYAAAAAAAGNPSAAALFASIAVACVAFLFFNRPPARVFMGDVGAVGLGFVAAAAGIEGVVDGLWPWWFPVLVFLPFIADATVTVLRRLVRGTDITQAHREHYYQRSILLDGGRHARTVGTYSVAMAGCGAVALAGLLAFPDIGVALLLASGAVAAACFVRIDSRWSARDRHAQ